MLDYDNDSEFDGDGESAVDEKDSRKQKYQQKKKSKIKHTRERIPGALRERKFNPHLDEDGDLPVDWEDELHDDFSDIKDIWED